MRKLLTIGIAILVLITTGGLSLKAQTCDTARIKVDNATIFRFIDALDAGMLKNLKTKFDNSINNRKVNIEDLDTFIHSDSINKITRTINLINAYVQRNATSCFKTLLRQELNDYLQSLDLVKHEALQLNNPTTKKLNAFGNLQFIAAYNYMNTSRALLKIAVDNLIDNCNVLVVTNQINSVQGDIKASTGQISESFKKIEPTVTGLPGQITQIKDTVNKNTDNKLKIAQDNINAATSKKTTEWGLLGGLLGGIVGGLIVHFLK